MSICVGSVPYVNAAPLVWAFEAAGAESPVRVTYEVPSRLPNLLESGACAAVMVSSVDALRVPDRRMAAGVGIVSHGPVQSVRLFCKVPPHRVRRLALDQSSMTSNRLAHLLLQERFGAVLESAVPMPPTLPEMLAKADAAVLIGDPGMDASGEGLHVVDMGEAWTDWTGLPFLWAAWFGAEALNPEVAGYLESAYAAAWEPSGEVHPSWLPRFADPASEVIRFAAGRSGWSEKRVGRYLREAIAFRVDDRVMAGYREFAERLRAAGFDDVRHFPRVVSPLATARV